MSRPLSLSLIAYAALHLTLQAEPFTFTGSAGSSNPFDWETAGNWRTDTQDPATSFPNNAQQVDGDDVSIEGTFVIQLSMDIGIRDFVVDSSPSTSGITLDLNDQLLNSTGPGSFTTSLLGGSGITFLSGSYQSTANIDLSGRLTLDDASFSTPSLTLDATSSLNLRNLSTLTATSALTFGGDIGVSSSTTDPGNLVVEGIWRKTSGAGRSDVTAPVTLADGASLIIESGNMFFSHPVTMGDVTIDTQTAGDLVTFNDHLVLNDTLDAVLGPNGGLNFNAATLPARVLDMTGGGSIASSGNGRVLLAGRVIQKGGTLMGSSASPIMISGSASIGEESATTNAGRLIWDSGIIRGLTNTATGPDFLTIEDATLPGAAIRQVSDGTLRNEGKLRHDGVSVQLLEDGVIENVSGATYEFGTSGSVTLAANSNGQFTNAGTITKSGGGISTVSAHVQSDGTLESTNGTLRVANATLIEGTVRSDRRVNASAEVELGTSGSTNAFGDVVFDVIDNGVIQFISGDHELRGRFTSSGTGRVEASSSFAHFKVLDGNAATFAFGADAPFIAGTATADPIVDLIGSLTNEGPITCLGLRLHGSGFFFNNGPFSFPQGGSLEISDVTGATGGQFHNHHTVSFDGNNATARIQDGGFFLNARADAGAGFDEDGVILFNGTSQSFSTNGTGDQPKLENRSLIRNVNGTNTLGVHVSQTDALAEMRAERGRLRLSGQADLMLGTIASTNVAADATPSRVLIDGDSQLGTITLQAANDGRIEFGGFGSEHQLTDELTSAGIGETQLTNGTLGPAAGASDPALAFVVAHPLRIMGGALGSNEGPLSNEGAIILQSGRLNGSMRNQPSGRIAQEGGTVQGSITNIGTYDWEAGTVSGMLANGSLADVSGTLNLIDSAGKVLGNGGMLEAFRPMNHTGTGQLQLLGTAQVIIQDGGSYEMTNSGGIQSNAAASAVRVHAGGRIRKNGAPNATVSPDIFETEGILEATLGSLMITANTFLVNGGSAEVAPTASLILSRLPNGSQFTTIKANGLFRVNDNGTGARATYPQMAGQQLSGTGTTRLDLQQEGTVAPGNSIGTLTIDGDLSQRATAITEIEIGGRNAGQFDVINVLDEATVAGTIKVAFTDGFVPEVGDQFRVITTVNGLTLGAVTVETTTLSFINERFEASTDGSDLILTLTKTGKNFSEWKEEKFTPAEQADENISGPMADPDNDVIVNFLEFIYGFDPKGSNGDHPIDFQLMPTATAGVEVPRFEVAVDPNASGYRLGINALDLTQTPILVTPLPTRQDLTVPASMAAFEGTSPAPALRDFYQMEATGRGLLNE